MKPKYNVGDTFWEHAGIFIRSYKIISFREDKLNNLMMYRVESISGIAGCDEELLGTYFKTREEALKSRINMYIEEIKNDLKEIESEKKKSKKESSS